MPLVFNTKTYTPDSYGTDAVNYVGAANTISVLDQLRLHRVKPIPTKVYSGNARSFAKFSRTVTLANALTPTGVLVVEVSVSAPVGTAGADVDTALNDAGAYVSSADFKTQVKNQKIAF